MRLGATVLVFGGAILASAFSRAQTSIEIPGGSVGIGWENRPQSKSHGEESLSKA